MHTAPVRFNEFGSDHLIFAVIGTLDQYIGVDRLYRVNRRRLVEGHDIINRLYAGEHRGPSADTVQWTSRPLEQPNAFIAVEGDDEQIRLRSRLLKVLNVAGMQYVEATIREGDTVPRAPAAVELRQ